MTCRGTRVDLSVFDMTAVYKYRGIINWR